MTYLALGRVVRSAPWAEKPAAENVRHTNFSLYLPEPNNKILGLCVGPLIANKDIPASCKTSMSAILKPSLDQIPISSGEIETNSCGDISGASVLLTDESYKHSLGIMRQLGKMGVRVSVVAHSTNSAVCRSRYCHDIIRAEAPSTEACLAAAYQAVKRNRYDLLMPVSYPMTLAVAKNREKFLPHVKLELSGTADIERAADKAEMTKLAIKIGIPTPKTRVLSSLHDLEQRIDEIKFPIVVKPLKESRKGVVAYAHNRDQLQNICAARIAGLDSGAWEAQILQEFIPGYGCGFFATYQHGICKRLFMHRRVREFPANGGASSCAESFFDPALEKYGRRMLDALQWHGVAMVEFRRDSRDGDYKLIEVNPKFWGSLDLALAADADFPGDLCRMALGEDLPFTDVYQRNLRFQWPLSTHGDLFHLWMRPASFINVMGDLLNPRVKSNVSWTDPGPNFQELGELASTFLRIKKRKS